jgi:pyruvate dehydrogenase E2 component (dihydrolipoamide acetyltransferase)
MYEFLMPSLGADMESGVLLAWEVKPGASVKRGDIIATVGTEKGDIGAEVYADGVLAQILIAEGEEVPVGTVLALVRTEEGEEIPAPVVEKAPAPVAEAAIAANGQKAAPPASVETGERVRVSPLARKIAAELGVDLSTVKGTGPHGSISRSDIEQVHARQLAAKRVAGQQATEAKPKPAPPPARPPVAEPSPPVREEAAAPAQARAPVDFQKGMRQAIARAMARSNREIPHYYLETRIDMTRALEWLEVENLKRPITERILPVVILLKAVALALVDVPDLNGFWADDRHQPQEAIHIGFAIALRQGGLITPAIHHVDQKSLTELMEALRDLITRTREGRLRSSEMTDSTITVSSLGDLGVETVYGVIYPPQVALVGLGRIAEQPWAENGMIGIRKIMNATLAGDHRATDGRRGAQFLTQLNRYLQEPEKL